MPDFTDRAPRGEAPRTLLITMADRLDQDPEHDADALFANTQRVALASELTDNEPLFDELIIAAPVITSPTTRGQYAQRLREIAGVR
jgi:hypothetical protein